MNPGTGIRAGTWQLFVFWRFGCMDDKRTSHHVCNDLDCQQTDYAPYPNRTRQCHVISGTSPSCRLSDGGAPPPAGWPTSGAISYVNVTASYRPGLPAVLKNLTFSLSPGTSCGVVGRTGSGKSSLMLTLFRMIDINEGSIYLDGADTSKIALDSLRRQLAIIPQVGACWRGIHLQVAAELRLLRALGPLSRWQSLGDIHAG